jgi:hypothetical protein
MNTQNENQNDFRTAFPEPQTIPTGWDTSVFSSAQQDSVVDELSDESDE